MKLVKCFISVFICFYLFISTPVLALTAKNETKKIVKLEQRIVELEAIVQALLKASDQNPQLSPKKTKKNKGPEIELPQSKKANQSKINQKSIANNLKEIEKIKESSIQAELAMYSYEDLTEQIDRSMQLSGYADVEYKGSSEPGINEEFRMHHLSLFFTKQFDNRLKFFSEIEYEDTPKFDGVNDGSGDLKSASGKIFVEAINFDWNHSQHFNIRVGRFFTPAGIWSEDHYPPFVATQERPLHIRKIFPQLVDGASIFGSTEFMPDHFFNYTSFIGNGESNVSGKKDLNSNKAVGFKGDYKAPWLDDFTLGFTLYNDNKDSSNKDVEKFAYGFHLLLRQNNLTFQSEYAASDIESTDPINDYKSKGYYAQFIYGFDQWSIGYRYDFFDKKSIDLEEVQRNSFFINYRLNEYFSLKGEYHDDRHQDPAIDEYGYYIFSITGYLGN